MQVLSHYNEQWDEFYYSIIVRYLTEIYKRNWDSRETKRFLLRKFCSRRWYENSHSGLNARDAMTLTKYVLFFSVRKSFQKFHSLIGRCVYSHSICLCEIWATLAIRLEKYIENIEPNPMTPKGQKVEDASLFACFSLPMSFYCETSLAVGNRQHFSVFNKRKKSRNIIRWRWIFLSH